MIYIIDTHAWIEYFEGSKMGILLGKIIKKPNSKLITMECCLAEFMGWCIRENHDFYNLFNIIKANSLIFSISLEQWLDAGKIKSKMRGKRQGFGLIDAILLSKQVELKCKLISGDSHFKGLKDVIFLE